MVPTIIHRFDPMLQATKEQDMVGKRSAVGYESNYRKYFHEGSRLYYKRMDTFEMSIDLKLLL